MLYFSCEKKEKSKKEAGFGPFKKNFDGFSVLILLLTIRIRLGGHHSSVDPSHPAALGFESQAHHLSILICKVENDTIIVSGL